MAIVEDAKSTKSVSRTFVLVSEEEISCVRAGVVQIHVTDTGAGMTEEQMATLGKEGIQFNVNELQAGCGSGLGMFITKGIVQQHGGELEVSSRGLGRGTTFTCALPLYSVIGAASVDTPTTGEDTAFVNTSPIDCEDKAQVLREEQQLRQEEKGQVIEKEEFRPLRILVGDDVATNRKLLSRIVKNRGHIVDDACDGRVAVNKVKELQKDNVVYDTILMDYEMPVLRGPEAAKEIREIGCGSFIVGITGNLFVEEVNYFKSCGANHVLPKPVNIGKLEDLWMEHGIVSIGEKD